MLINSTLTLKLRGERLLWNGATEKIIHVKICILQLLVVPHSEQLPGLRVDLQSIFGGFLWNRNETEKEAPDRSFKNRMLQRCLLEVTDCPYIVQFLEFFGSENSLGCQQRAVQRDEAGEWKKAGYCSGCGVGCRNALGMQRPHVRQRERALCENTEAECQSCGEPLSRFFILVLVVALPCLGSVRIGVNFLECAGVWSEISRYRGAELPWSGKDVWDHPTFPVCSVPPWHGLEHPLWAGCTQSTQLSFAFPQNIIPFSFPGRTCVTWNVHSWRRKTLGSRKERLHTGANVKAMLDLTMVHIVSGCSDVRALLWNSSKSWAKQRQHAWEGRLCD